MAMELKMPKMGLTMTTADVGKWLKKEGESVKQGEAVVEVMTDKLTNQIESPVDGVLLKIVALMGAKLEAGGLMAYIGQPGETVAESTSIPKAASPSIPKAASVSEPQAAAGDAVAASSPQSGGRVIATPAARALAKDKGLDLAGLKGTGPGGRISKEDVEAVLSSGAAAPSAPQPEITPASACSQDQEEEVIRRVPYSGMRLAIGRNMHKSWTEIPRVTLHTEVVMDDLLTLRKLINAKADPMSRVSVTDMLVKLIAAAVGLHPEINARFDGQEMKIMKNVNMGVAVALDGGLVVPVIKRVESKSLRVISAELKDLAFKAKNGTLKLDEMSSGTLTISNLGGYGSVDTFNPIINVPEVAIIGLGRSRQVPVVVNNEVIIATVMSISVTHDHRVLDGAPVAAFMATLNGLITDPMAGLL